MEFPKITVLSLGGTISSTNAGGSGVKPTLTSEALVADVPEVAEIAEISAASFRQVASGELTVDDLVELAGEIMRRIDVGASGVVITQGTDTIEETAFALDLLVDYDAPVVVTGAMRNPTLPGAEGPANLLASVQVAASEDARGIGTVVVLNDEIHAARYVQKTHTQNTATFCSSLIGPLGWLAEGEPRIAVRLVNRHHIDLSSDAQTRPVALLTVSLGEDGRFLKAVKDLGYAGLVIEALGGGHVPSLMVEPLASLVEEMPVVLASRTGNGEVLQRTYGFPGSETELLDRGLIPAGPLDGPKARVLLTLLLRSGAAYDEVSHAFGHWLGDQLK